MKREARGRRELEVVQPASGSEPVSLCLPWWPSKCNAWEGIHLKLTVINSRFYNEANGTNMMGSVCFLVTCSISRGHANVAAAAGLRFINVSPGQIENVTFINSYCMLCAQMFLHVGSISSLWWNIHFASIASCPVVVFCAFVPLGSHVYCLLLAALDSPRTLLGLRKSRNVSGDVIRTHWNR